MQRRAQQPISIRSNRAAELLAIHTRYGRSQAAVIEEALELPRQPDDDGERWLAGMKQIIARTSKRKIPSMAEFDAKEYGERGNLR